MKLLHQLKLSDATTESVDLTPTKKFFKPVVVVTAPITKETGELLEVGYLWDGKGNPHKFDGNHKLPGGGDIPGAEVIFAGKVASPVTLLTEKVTQLVLFVVEKQGMQIRLRIHLPEDKTKMYELLEFLSNLNKDGYSLTVNPGQRPITEDQPLGPGLLMKSAKDTRRFKNPKLVIEVGVVEQTAGWVSWWEVRWSGGEEPKIAGEQPRADGTHYGSEMESYEAGGRAAYEYLTSEGITVGMSAKAAKLHSAGVAFLCEAFPGLVKETAHSA